MMMLSWLLLERALFSETRSVPVLARFDVSRLCINLSFFLLGGKKGIGPS